MPAGSGSSIGSGRARLVPAKAFRIGDAFRQLFFLKFRRGRSFVATQGRPLGRQAHIAQGGAASRPLLPLRSLGGDLALVERTCLDQCEHLAAPSKPKFVERVLRDHGAKPAFALECDLNRR